MKNYNIFLTFYVLITLFFHCLNNSNNISIYKKSYNINYKSEDKTFYVKEEITYSLKNSMGNTIKSENENYLMRIKQYFSNQYSNLLIQGKNISKVKIENDKEYIIANVQFNFSFNKENLENSNLQNGLYLYKLKYSYNIHRDINFLLRDNNLIYEDFDFFLLNKINENSFGETKFKTDIEIKFQFNESNLSIEEKDNSLFYIKNKNLLKNSISNSDQQLNIYKNFQENSSSSLNTDFNSFPLRPQIDNPTELSNLPLPSNDNIEFSSEDLENVNYLQNTEMSMKDFMNLNNSITLYFKDLLGDLVICSVHQGKIEKNPINNQYIASYKFTDLVFGSNSYEKFYFTQIFNSLAHKELEKYIISNNIVFYIFYILFFIITTFVLIKLLLSFRAKESASINIDTNISKLNMNKKGKNDKSYKEKKIYDLDFSSDSSDEEIENEDSNGKKNSKNFNQDKNNISTIDTLSLDDELKTEDIIIYQ